MSKRQTMDNGKWLRTLKRENVSLVTDGIARIDETGVIDNAGVHHDVDIIVYATGYQAHRVLFPMKFKGRNGLDLNDYWGNQANAYLGITVPNFPNLFMVWGPGTSPVTSAILTSEWQTRYIHEILKTMVVQGISAVDCIEDKYLDYNQRTQEERETLVTSLPGVDNW
jgi:4-hydroxyacetophenone monooxygenase